MEEKDDPKNIKTGTGPAGTGPDIDKQPADEAGEKKEKEAKAGEAQGESPAPQPTAVEAALAKAKAEGDAVRAVARTPTVVRQPGEDGGLADALAEAAGGPMPGADKTVVAQAVPAPQSKPPIVAPSVAKAQIKVELHEEEPAVDPAASTGEIDMGAAGVRTPRQKWIIAAAVAIGLALIIVIGASVLRSTTTPNSSAPKILYLAEKDGEKCEITNWEPRTKGLELVDDAGEVWQFTDASGQKYEWKPNCATTGKPVFAELKRAAP